MGNRLLFGCFIGICLVLMAGLCLAESTSGGTAVATAKAEQGSDEALESGEDDLMAELGADYPDSDMGAIADPLEPWNRLVFQVNDKLYLWILDPVARGYAATVPQPWRESYANAFYNVATPVRMVNDFLQGKPVQAFQELGSFVINTLFGFGGLLEPAENIDFLQPDPADTDTGLTLGTWGLGHGIYMVWPVLGPSSLRDTVGKVGDSFMNPLSYVSPWELSAGLKTGERVNALSLRLGEYQDFKESALDPYTAFKDGYIQYRQKALKEEN